MYDVSLKRKWDQEAVRQYQEQEQKKRLEEGFEQGMQQGIEQGRREERAKAEAEKKSTVLKMLAGGFAVEVVADMLGLSIEDIEKLK